MNSAAQTKSTGSAPVKLPNARSITEQETELVILPDPVGYQMLVALPTAEQKTAAGVYIPDVVSERERAATVIGTVLAMGDMCYKDMSKFGVDEEWTGGNVPGEPEMVRRLGKPWCKVGDTVLFSRYSGMRFKSKDIESGDMVEYRMLSDDQIVGTVPEGAQVGGI